MSMKFTGWQCSASSTKWSLDAFIGVWSYDDNGDVPPKWEIPIGQVTKMKKPFGVVLDLKHKELIVSDMRNQGILSFSVPEIF